ncbi:MAG: hypothetical protein JKY27_09700, partial [Magnetovibrio sp.]|nr:hypothetical protein [Magnetovibrio sp.]
MDGSFDVEQLNQVFEGLIAFVQTHVLVIPNLVQLAVVVLTYFTARITARPAVQLLDKTLAGDWANKYRHQATVILRPLVLPLAWLVYAGMAQLSALQLAWPSAIIGFCVSLLTAWVVIRLMLNFIADPWWSKAAALFVWAVTALDIIGLLNPVLAFMDSLAIDLGTFRLSLLVVVKGVVALVVLLWLANSAARMVDNRLKAISDESITYGAIVTALFGPVAGSNPFRLTTDVRTRRFTQELRLASIDNK